MYALSVQCRQIYACSIIGMHYQLMLAVHYPVYLSGTSEQPCRTGIPDSVWRKKLTCQVAFGDLTTFENLIRSTGQESKPDVFLEVSSGIPEQVSVINFAIKKTKLNFNVTFFI